MNTSLKCKANLINSLHGNDRHLEVLWMNGTYKALPMSSPTPLAGETNIIPMNLVGCITVPT